MACVSLMQPPNSKAVAGNVSTLFLLIIVHKYTRTQKTSYRSLYIFTARAAVIRHNRLYSVNGVRINCSSENVTVLGPPQVYMKRFYCDLFLHDTFHFGVRQRSQKLILHKIFDAY